MRPSTSTPSLTFLRGGNTTKMTQSAPNCRGYQRAASSAGRVFASTRFFLKKVIYLPTLKSERVHVKKKQILASLEKQDLATNPRPVVPPSNSQREVRTSCSLQTGTPDPDALAFSAHQTPYTVRPKVSSCLSPFLCCFSLMIVKRKVE